jgi:DNA-binding NtrC family response regulator
MNALPGRVLVVDDEPNISDSIKKALERSGYAVETATDAGAAWSALERSQPDLALFDVRLGSSDGMDLLVRVAETFPDVAVVMMTGYASIESAVAAVKAGAADYLSKPFNPEQLRHVVARVLDGKRLRDENSYLRSEIQHLRGQRVIVGESQAMQQLFAIARAVAETDSGVLITGETGTGKEVVARFVHERSRRHERPFVTVNCAAIPANLLESELFGHRRGAFTGATYNRRGSFEMADGGTLFLDEIGEMPLDMQAKILRALEERQVKRIGSDEAVRVNARIVAATNRDPEAEVKAGRFREDLYWRLNVVRLVVPPLRERPEDIAALAQHFLAFFAHEMKKPVGDFSPEAVDIMTRYEWPGNVREVRNAVERAVIFAEAGRPIRVGHLPAYLRQERDARPPAAPPAAARSYRPLREMEMDYIREVLEACGGNRTRAAEMLGLSPVTLWRKLGRDNGDDAHPLA